VAIQMGLQVVNETLANNYIRADESMKAQSKVKEKGRWTFIDKVRVRLVDSDYWAEVNNFGSKFVHIPTDYVRDYERLLTGGIWAQVVARSQPAIAGAHSRHPRRVAGSAVVFPQSPEDPGPDAGPGPRFNNGRHERLHKPHV
jgi:hypothetical protein